MDLNQQLYVIVNPASARGHTRQRWGHIEALLRQHTNQIEIAWTQAPGHAIELARAAAARRVGTVVCVGGDGTVNDVVNGLMQIGTPNDAHSRPQLALIPQGTGTDFARSIGLHKQLPKAVHVDAHGQAKCIDIGHIRCSAHANTPATRQFFINVAGLGFDAEGVQLLAKKGKRAGTIAYFTMVLELLRTYKNKALTVKVHAPNQMHTLTGNFNSVIAGNARYFGGGMKVAPNADHSDGLFDVIVVGDITPVAFMSQFVQIYRGTHLNHPKVQFYRAHAIEVHAQEGHDALIEAEGELFGAAPAHISILPAALRVKM